MNQEQLPDGSVKVVLAKRGDKRIYTMVARNLYQVDEVVISEEIIGVG